VTRRRGARRLRRGRRVGLEQLRAPACRSSAGRPRRAGGARNGLTLVGWGACLATPTRPLTLALRLLGTHNDAKNCVICSRWRTTRRSRSTAISIADASSSPAGSGRSSGTSSCLVGTRRRRSSCEAWPSSASYGDEASGARWSSMRWQIAAPVELGPCSSRRPQPILRFYQLLGFRMLRVERDAFTASAGYPHEPTIDGIPLRDRIWLSLSL
jgi:hypothetical protein